MELKSIKGGLGVKIKLVELSQMKVASFHYVGQNPELNAIKSMFRWAQRKEFFSKDVKFHFFLHLPQIL